MNADIYLETKINEETTYLDAIPNLRDETEERMRGHAKTTVEIALCQRPVEIGNHLETNKQSKSHRHYPTIRNSPRWGGLARVRATGGGELGLNG